MHFSYSLMRPDIYVLRDTEPLNPFGQQVRAVIRLDDTPPSACLSTIRPVQNGCFVEPNTASLDQTGNNPLRVSDLSDVLGFGQAFVMRTRHDKQRRVLLRALRSATPNHAFAFLLWSAETLLWLPRAMEAYLSQRLDIVARRAHRSEGLTYSLQGLLRQIRITRQFRQSHQHTIRVNRHCLPCHASALTLIFVPRSAGAALEARLNPGGQAITARCRNEARPRGCPAFRKGLWRVDRCDPPAQR